MDFGFGGAAEIKKVEEFDFKCDSLAPNHDVVVVDVAVVFAAGVNRSDTAPRGCTKHLTLRTSSGDARAAWREISLSLIPSTSFRNDYDHFFAFDVGCFLMMVLP